MVHGPYGPGVHPVRPGRRTRPVRATGRARWLRRTRKQPVGGPTVSAGASGCWQLCSRGPTGATALGWVTAMNRRGAVAGAPPPGPFLGPYGSSRQASDGRIAGPAPRPGHRFLPRRRTTAAPTGPESAQRAVAGAQRNWIMSAGSKGAACCSNCTRRWDDPCKALGVTASPLNR